MKMDRKRWWKLLILLLPVVMLMTGISACTGRKGLSGAAGQNFFVGAMWWTNSYNQTTQEGKQAYWDNRVFEELKADFVSVIFRTRDEKVARDVNGGKPVRHMDLGGWVQPYALGQAAIDQAQAGLDEAKAMGIRILPSINTLMFCSTAYEDLGLDPKDYYGRKADGSFPKYGSYEDCYLSCISNPNWRDVVRDIAARYARAGYCGIYFDLFPYGSGAGLLCHCDHCKAKWAERSKELFGSAQPIPATLSYTSSDARQNAVCMQFLRWRYEELNSFMKEMEKEGQKYNREYHAYINSSVENLANQYMMMQGMRQMTSELLKLALGDSSGLYLYRAAESLSGENRVWAHFNGPSQYAKGQYQASTLVAEAYAGGGSAMLFATNTAQRPYSIQHSQFLHAHRDAYEDTVSAAETAIFYSWEDQQFVHTGSHTNTAGAGWEKNPARRASEILAQESVPFDYLSYEMNDRRLEEALFTYRTVILPELKLVSDAMLEALSGYVRRGGQLLVLGACGAWTYDAARLGLISRQGGPVDFAGADWTGNGRVIFLDTYLKTGSSAAVARPTSQMEQAFADFGLYYPVKVDENRSGFVESTLRKDRDGKLYLHLVHFGAGNSDNDYKQTPYHVSLALPESMRDGRIRVAVDQMPVADGFAEDLFLDQCRVIDGRLELHGNFSLYALVTIEKADAPLEAIGPEIAMTVEKETDRDKVILNVTGMKINPSGTTVQVTFDAPVEVPPDGIVWYYVDTNGSLAGNENRFAGMVNAGPKTYGGAGYRSDYTWYGYFKTGSAVADRVPAGMILVVEIRGDKITPAGAEEAELEGDVRLYFPSTEGGTEGKRTLEEALAP